MIIPAVTTAETTANPVSERAATTDTTTNRGPSFASLLATSTASPASANPAADPEPGDTSAPALHPTAAAEAPMPTGATGAAAEQGLTSRARLGLQPRDRVPGPRDDATKRAAASSPGASTGTGELAELAGTLSTTAQNEGPAPETKSEDPATSAIGTASMHPVAPLTMRSEALLAAEATPRGETADPQAPSPTGAPPNLREAAAHALPADSASLAASHLPATAAPSSNAPTSSAEVRASSSADPKLPGHLHPASPADTEHAAPRNADSLESPAATPTQASGSAPATTSSATATVQALSASAPPAAVVHHVEAPSALSATPGSAPTLPGVASQLVSVIGPLRNGSDGSQSLTIALHPEGLGTVRATLNLDDGQLLIRLAPSSPAGESAIRAALPELHAGLSEDAPRPTVVLVQPGTAGSEQGGQQQGTPAGSGETARHSAGVRDGEGLARGGAPTAGAATRPGTTTSSLLDLRL